MSHFNLSALTTPMTEPEGLIHAVLQSILNHAKSTQNDRARMKTDERGGCWNEAYIAAIGSRDWTLSKEKNTQQNRLRAQRFYEEALAWLLDEGHVLDIRVEVIELTKTTIGRKVIITPIEGEAFEIPL